MKSGAKHAPLSTCMYVFIFTRLRLRRRLYEIRQGGRVCARSECWALCPWRARSLLSRAKHTPSSSQQQHTHTALSPDSRAQIYFRLNLLVAASRVHIRVCCGGIAPARPKSELLG